MFVIALQLKQKKKMLRQVNCIIQFDTYFKSKGI